MEKTLQEIRAEYETLLKVQELLAKAIEKNLDVKTVAYIIGDMITKVEAEYRKVLSLDLPKIE